MHATIPSKPVNANRFAWRIVDIVTAAVLGIAGGVLFFAGDIAYTPLSVFLGVTPGLEGLTAAFWLFMPVLGGLIIRKPGAAVVVSIIAAIVEMAFFPGWGPMTIVVALVQGIGAEAGIAIFGYASSRLSAAIVSGALAGVANAAVCLVLYYPTLTFEVAAIYTVSAIVSGVVLAGILAFIVAKALAKTGALARFPLGKTA